MNNLIRYVPIALIAGYFLYANFSSTRGATDDIDLNQVLDVTVETVYAFEENNTSLDSSNQDATFIKFSEDLAVSYNSATPAIYNEPINVDPQSDASLIAYVDKNGNQKFDNNSDDGLYMIEVDGENSRVIATSGSGAVNERRFSGSGILTGMLIGSMLSRQRASGVNTKNISNKSTKTAKQAARSRSGSGSHSRGK